MKWTTHRVENQVPPLQDYNLFQTDKALLEGSQREGAQAWLADLTAYGAWLGQADTIAQGATANVNQPVAHIFDRWGNRVDAVHFDPAWHTFMRQGFQQGMHCSAWAEPRQGAQVARAINYLMHGQVEAGSLCPLTMTSAAIPLLQKESFFDMLEPFLYSRAYDPTDAPLDQKASMMVGMGMTEKQGGSDLRTNTTRAAPVGAGGRGGEYLLTGHKWFFSSPTSDAHLVLAGHEQQLSCFYVPRWLPDGRRNSVHLQRLKNKMGNTSNASGEVEFKDAYGLLVSEPGRGVATLVEMAANTRLDCVLGSAALLRQAVVQAIHHARHRNAFGKFLIDQPLMGSVLTDLALESEAATMLALRLARAFEPGDDPLEQAYRRILTPASKFWVCKRTIEAMGECMEVWGGNGYIEDGPMPRLYREAPVNSIWEGSGNVMCLDVLRGIQRDPELSEALSSSLLRDSADEPVLAKQAQDLMALLTRSGPDLQAAARYVAQQLVLIVQANLMRRHSPTHVADTFIRTRFGSESGRVFGVVSDQTVTRAIFQRAWH